MAGSRWSLWATGFNILVLHLFSGDAAVGETPGVRDEDIAHAFEHSVSWLELDDDPLRYLVAGPDRADNLLELVVVEGAGDVFVIHAMALRASAREALFGDDRS